MVCSPKHTTCRLGNCIDILGAYHFSGKVPDRPVLLDKFRLKLHWIQAHDSFMATAFSLISFQSFLLWRDKGKDYDQDEVILRQLRSACSKTTRQLMGISTFYLDSTFSIYRVFFPGEFLIPILSLWLCKGAPFCTFTLFFLPEILSLTRRAYRIEFG